MIKYETGSRLEVLRVMVHHAIQDRQALLDSYAHCREDYPLIISLTEAEIRDYQKFRRTLK